MPSGRSIVTLLDSISAQLPKHRPHQDYACQWCGAPGGVDSNPLVMEPDALGRALGICRNCILRAANLLRSAGHTPTF